MPAKKYIVKLEEEERTRLLDMLKGGRQAARKLTRARILLKADEGWRDQDIADALETSRSTVEQVRQRLVEGGLENALNEKKRPGAQRKLDGKQEAYLIATACSKTPRGHQDWTLRMLADKVVEWGWVESISPETIRSILQKTTSNRG
jgi:transposase